MLIQPWITVLYCYLLWLKLYIRAGSSISHIYPFPGYWSMVDVILFYVVIMSNFYIVFVFLLPTVVLNCFSCSVCLWKTCINLTSFLFKSKFLSFQICDSAHLLSHCCYYHKNCSSSTYSYFYLHALFSYYFSFLLFYNVKISLIFIASVFIFYQIFNPFFLSPFFILLLIILLLFWFCFFLFTSD